MSDVSGGQKAMQPTSEQLQAALQAVTEHSTRRLEQIIALGQSLNVFLDSPEFQDEPWLARSQLEALVYLSREAASDIRAATKGLIRPMLTTKF